MAVSPAELPRFNLPWRASVWVRGGGELTLGGVAPDGQQRIEVVKEVRRRRRAEGDDPVLVEVGDRARLAALLEIVGRGVGVKVDGEQPTADQVGLHRLAQA